MVWGEGWRQVCAPPPTHHHTNVCKSSLFCGGSLSSDVFERRKSTGSGLFALLSSDFEQTFGQIVSIRVKTLSNT